MRIRWRSTTLKRNSRGTVTQTGSWWLAHSQHYPAGLGFGRSDRGNFLGFVSNISSAFLLKRSLDSFRRATSLPAEGAAAPEFIPGVGWSDHWSFWQAGYHAVMVTDTAPYRYPWYHTASDTPEKLDYERMARAVSGLAGVIRDAAQPVVSSGAGRAEE